MSSVSGSGSSNRQDEVIRRNREEYQNNESEMVKKHNKELRRISEQHYEEIENLKSDYQKQISALKEASQNTVTKRDNKYQSEIESMRKMHKNQLKNISEGAQKRGGQQVESIKAASDHKEIQMEAQIQRLKDDYETAMSEREEIYNRNIEANREGMKKGLSDQKAKLDEAHQREIKFLRDDRDQRIGQLKNEYDKYRTLTTAEKKSQTLQNIQNQERASDNLLRAVRREREGRFQSEAMLREGFEDGLDNVRDRFEKAREKERAANELTRDQLQADVHGRLGRKISSLEDKNLDLKDVQVREQLNMKQQKQRELNNIRDSYQKTLENMQGQRNEAIRQSNDRNKKDINELTLKHSELFQSANRENMHKLQDQEFKYRADRGSLKGSLEARAEQAENTANLRVENILEKSEANNQRVNKMSMETQKSLRQSHADEIRELRFKFEEEKRNAIELIRDQAAKMEVQHQEKVAQLQSKHEKEMLSMKDQMLLMKKENDETLKRTVSELQRAHELSLSQQEYRHKDKLKALDLDHTNEMKTINRRNDEKVSQMSAAIKKKS